MHGQSRAVRANAVPGADAAAGLTDASLTLGALLDAGAGGATGAGAPADADADAPPPRNIVAGAGKGAGAVNGVPGAGGGPTTGPAGKGNPAGSPTTPSCCNSPEMLCAIVFVLPSGRLSTAEPRRMIIGFPAGCGACAAGEQLEVTNQAKEAKKKTKTRK